MKVIVLGAGVIGVTTAYYLNEAGHEVVVYDRQAGPAMETSFGNAGEISPGYSSPWAGPGMPLKAIKWLLMRHGPLVLRPGFDPKMWVWLFKMLRNCTAERYAVNKSRMVPLAEYSRDCLRELRAATGISYDERSQGTLQLFRSQEQLDGTGKDIEILKQFGVPYRAARSGRLHRRGAGPVARRRQDRRRPAPAGRRNRRLQAVYRAADDSLHRSAASFSISASKRDDWSATDSISRAPQNAATRSCPSP